MKRARIQKEMSNLIDRRASQVTYHSESLDLVLLASAIRSLADALEALERKVNAILNEEGK